jgi:hypothetical protein
MGGVNHRWLLPRIRAGPRVDSPKWSGLSDDVKRVMSKSETTQAEKRLSGRAKLAKLLRVRPSRPCDEHFEDLPVSINVSSHGSSSIRIAQACACLSPSRLHLRTIR